MASYRGVFGEGTELRLFPGANGVKPPNCPNCPLDVGDAGRIRWMVDWLKQLESVEQAAR